MDLLASAAAHRIDAAGPGVLPGSPAFTGGPAGHSVSVAVDAGRRRVFVASDTLATVSVFTLDSRGSPSPAPGSPFALERAQPTAIALGTDALTLYVGYEG